MKFRRADLLSRLAIGIAAIALIGGPSLAATPKEKPSPAPRPVPVQSWTGFYLGGNLGYGWGGGRTNLEGNGSVAANIGGFAYPSSFAFADSDEARLNRAIGGGQFGFNYQFSPKWVFGLEADIQDASKNGTGMFADSFATPICTTGTLGGTCIATTTATGTALTAYQAKIDWFGTVRSRLGFLPSSQLLIYVTGGLAYGHVEVSGSTNVTTTFVGQRTGTAAFGVSGTNVGFTVGTGMEGKFPYWLPANWTWKLEYLYLDLGSLDASTPFATPPLIHGFPVNITSPAIGTITTLTHFTDNIVRVGLNYIFN
jgi:outer membrane immunogenic protein